MQGLNLDHKFGLSIVKFHYHVTTIIFILNTQAWYAFPAPQAILLLFYSFLINNL